MSSHSGWTAPQPTTRPRGVGDPEVLDVLVELHALLGEQDAIARVQLDQIVDGAARRACVRGAA